MQRIALAIFALALSVASALAQTIPPGTNPVPAGGAYNSSPPTITSGQAGYLQIDSAGNLRVTGTVTSTPGGTASNASSAVATSATNTPTVAYNYGFNGTTWDQLQVDGSKQLKVVPPTTTNAGAATVKGGVGVVNGGSTYQTIAASQTAQVLQVTTGAIGDYLSHCVIQPTTTAAGTMTILDNATVIFTFTTGTLSNLAPISVPIGALSRSGAWKVTTGANETATCFGAFS